MEVLNNICLDIVDCEHKTAPIQNEGIPSIRTTDIKNGFLDLKGSNKVSEETYKKWTQRLEPQPHDLILAREAPVGQVGIIPFGQRVCLGQRTVLIRPNQQKVYPFYLLYLLLSREIQHKMKVRASGSTVEHLNMLDIRNLQLPDLPLLNIQKEIGDTLGNLDAKIENLRRQNETLEQIAQTLFKHWFIDFEFPNADGKPYKSSGGAMSPSELGDIPEGWRVEILKNIMTLNYGKSLTAENRINGKYPVVGSNGIVDTHTDFFVKGPGIVIGRKGTIGKVIWIEENFYPIDTTFYIEDNLGCEGLYFHYFLLKNQKFNKLTSDSAVPGLNRDMAYSVEFAISSNALINQYNSIAKTIFHKINNNEKQIQTLTKTRDALLPKLMSGQLRVKE
jgi:type I restriction enzyme S subunit